MTKGEIIFRYVKFGFKCLGIGIIIFVYVLLFVRMCAVDGVPEGFDDLRVTNELIDIYNSEGGKDKFIYQSINKFNANKDSYGFFSVNKYVIIDGADQVQMIFKFNKSTLKSVAETYGLDEIDREARDTFQLSLVVKNAIGEIVPPETDESGFEVVPVDYNDERNEGKTYTLERIFPIYSEQIVEGRYNYIKLTFSKVDFDLQRTLAIFLDINYKDDIRYEQLNPDYDPENQDPSVKMYKDSYGRICIYNYTSPNRTYKFTKNDKAALTRER